MILLGSVGSPEPTWRLVPILTRGLGHLLRPLFPWNSDPESYQPPSKVTALNKLRGKLWIARLYSDHGLPLEMPEFLRRYIAVFNKKEIRVDIHKTFHLDLNIVL